MPREDTNFLENLTTITILLVFNLLCKLLAAKGEQGVCVNGCNTGGCLARESGMQFGVF